MPKHTHLIGGTKLSGKCINFIMISVSPSPLILFNAIELNFRQRKKLNLQPKFVFLLHENACFRFEISILKLIASTLDSQQILITNSSNFHVGFMFESANFHLNMFTKKFVFKVSVIYIWIITWENWRQALLLQLEILLFLTQRN